MHSSLLLRVFALAVLLPVCLGLGDLTCDAWVGATNCAVTGDHVIEGLRVSNSNSCLVLPAHCANIHALLAPANLCCC
jgi:hypothetical protein